VPKLQQIVPDAEKHFVIGTMTLTQALLRDVSKFTSTDEAERQVFDEQMSSNVGQVTQLLLGDLAFVRQICESAYVVSQYESLATTDLLNRLAAAGFRAVHVFDPALRKPISGRGGGGLVSQRSEPSPGGSRSHDPGALSGTSSLRYNVSSSMDDAGQLAEAMRRSAVDFTQDAVEPEPQGAGAAGGQPEPQPDDGITDPETFLRSRPQRRKRHLSYSHDTTHEDSLDSVAQSVGGKPPSQSAAACDFGSIKPACI